jgi:hypothetical protein
MTQARDEVSEAHRLPSGYPESRDTFHALAKNLGVEARRFFHDEQPGEHTRLSTDTVYLGRKDARNLVVIASGTHGVEGYAGAACQFHFMQTWRQRYARNNDIAYLLVHAVNPWGFLHDRRVTVEGVDLNRNFVDFPLTAQRPSGYRAYHHLLVSNFRPMPAGLWNELRLFSHALTAQRRTSMQAAVTAGQYDDPDGLFFGGFAPVNSRVVWERIIGAYATGRELAFLLDLHTGLGKRGVGELISYLPSSTGDFQRMNHWFHGSLKSVTDDSVSAVLEGTLTAGFDRSLACQSFAIGLEFGTRPALFVLNALRADQWYRNNASRLSENDRERVRRKMKNAFAISDAQWLGQVTGRFDEVIEQIVEGINTDPKQR